MRFVEYASRPGFTLWTPFAQDTAYFGDATLPFMLNFRVDALDGLVARMRAAGV